MKEVAGATARDFMSRELVTLTPDLDVLRAMRVLEEARISGAPVVDPRGRLVGILTQRDCLAVAVQATYHQEPAGRVVDYMTRDVKTLPATASLMDAIEAFLANPFRRFPILEGQRLVGQISRRDVVRAILELW